MSNFALRIAVVACAVLITSLEAVTVSAQTTPTLYVSNAGDDSWSGALLEPNAERTDGPFATLEAARDALRGLDSEGAAVVMRGGTYERDAAFELTAEDSGADGHPVVYRAAEGEGVRLVGGKRVVNFAPVTDATILDRLMPEARGEVLQAHLGALGITDFGSPGGGGIELFYDDEPMTPARWPNEGFVRVTGLVGGDPVDAD